jgi:hypothetical protein
MVKDLFERIQKRTVRKRWASQAEGYLFSKEGELDRE